MDRMIEGLDLARELEGILNGVGLSSADTGGAIAFEGADPVMESVFPMGSIAALTRMAPCVAAAALWKMRTGRGQDLRVHLGQVVHEFMPQPTLNGVHANDFNLNDGHFNGYNQNFAPTKDGRSISMASVYAPGRDALIEVLRAPPSRPDEVLKAVKQWDALDLEEVATAKGAIITMVRTPEEWLAHPHGAAMAQRPLVEIERIGDSAPEPLPPGTRPLSGIRAVGTVRMLAGTATAQTLAEHGAEVINLWRPEDYEIIQAYLKGHRGVGSAMLRDTTPEGRDKLRKLIEGADIVFENRRDGTAKRRGLDFDSCAAIRPGIIHVSVRCYGHYGPWSNRAGFDPQALSATGVAVAEGGGLDTPAYPPTRIVNDWTAPWLGAFGAMVALRRRATEGGSYRVRVSLARASMWWLGLPRMKKRQVAPLPEAAYYEADTPMGRFRTPHCQVRFSETQPHFETPLVPWGASLPAWRPR